MSFDETDLVPHAGLLPAAVLAQRIDLSGLIEFRLHLARHGANCGAKALTVLGSMLAPVGTASTTSQCCAGATASCSTGRGRRRRSVVAAGAQVVQRPQFDAISRGLLARSWAAAPHRQTWQRR